MDALACSKSAAHFITSIALSRDGAQLFRTSLETDVVDVYRVADGALVRTLGNDDALSFSLPRQVWVMADDGALLIAEWGSHRVQLLAADFSFRAFLGVGVLERPTGVCAASASVFVSEGLAQRITVLHVERNETLFHIPSLVFPQQLCVVAAMYVAVAEQLPVLGRVRLFAVADGSPVTALGAGVLREPMALAFCARTNKLAVADFSVGLVALDVDTGATRIVCRGRCDSVAIHGDVLLSVNNGGPGVSARQWAGGADARAQDAP